MTGQAIEAHPTQVPERRVGGNLPFRSSLSSLAGQYIMAITGLALILFILSHLAGNFLITTTLRNGAPSNTSYQHYEKGDLIAADPSRIAASVVTGIGFLGAGAILRTGLNIQGLTPAASLWLVAALGLAAGGGMYLETVTATGASLIALIVLRRVEDKRRRLMLRRAELRLGNAALRDRIIDELHAISVPVVEVEYQRDFQTNETGLLLDLHLSDENVLTTILARLVAIPELRSLKIQRPVG
jgi:putative Mg2+ transporter-C (MgtC) family protein